MKALIPSTACLLRGLVAALWLLTAAPVWAQRVQFPTPVTDGMSGTTSPPLVQVNPPAYSPSAPSTFAPNGITNSPLSGSGPAYDPYASPLAQAPPPAFNPPPTTYTPYTPTPYSPYMASPYAPTPQPLYPEGLQTPQFLQPGGFSFGQPIRFMQEVRGRFTWLSGNGSQGLSVTDVETSATFAIPFRTNAPFLITPGFGIHFFGGPITQPPDFADLPPRTYEGYVDGGWHPQITPWFGANLGVRVGAYTDFNTFTTHSIRIMGRGLGVITLTPTLQLAAGVVYIDRNRVKILPAGGLIWIPNPDARYDILFPNPKLAHRWTTLGNTDVWYYLMGEYGGGAWTIKRSSGANDDIDYNDIRVALGIESYGQRGLHAFFEVGYVFDRQILYRFSAPNFYPSDTVMLRAGLSY